MGQGFDRAEHAARWERAQAAMQARGLDALLLTTEPEFRYFAGFHTRFWESPTRPWYLILPAEGAPVAVIPEIGAPLMARGPVADIRTWPAPDYEDDGLALLAETLRERVPRGGRIAVPDGRETHVRMPFSTLTDLRRRLGARRIVGDGGLVAGLRAIKSAGEIEKIRAACAVAARAFDRLPEAVRIGDPLATIFRRFQALCLEEGADFVPYLAGAAGPGGYADVISPATEAPLAPGDVLMLDTGCLRDGYFCDFDRNFSAGPASAALAAAHARLLDATEAGFAAMRPGARACDVWQAMARVLDAPRTGRLGHGLGLQLTEGLSLHADDRTRLKPGMVLTLEPVLATGAGRILVHEEVVALGAAGPEFLTPFRRAPLPVIG